MEKIITHMDLRLKRTIIRIFDKSIKTSVFFRLMVAVSALVGLFFTLFNGTMLFYKTHLTEFITSTSFPESLYFYKENLLFFVTANRMMYLICFLSGLAILYGCHLLFRGYKWGLFFYTLAKVFQFLTPIFFLGYRMFAIGDLMLILLFLVYYYYYAFTHNIEKQHRKYNTIKIEE